ncbi:hypothetical protein [Caldifermentibacillus hisashii]|uniref:hypothetical protein n=1 Tax=Caldifermentibacillus hisashii TaxID=996558 RepID=UPI0022B9777F|nr:hypothetical protein [Caldifermentibacillus hisashii]
MELDYTNLYNDGKVPARFLATIIIEEHDGEKLIVDAIAEETNETFGVEKGNTLISVILLRWQMF